MDHGSVIRRQQNEIKSAAPQSCRFDFLNSRRPNPRFINHYPLPIIICCKKDDWLGKKDDWRGKKDDWRGKKDDWRGKKDGWRGMKDGYIYIYIYIYI